ncbi:hypothetical protein [Lewinella sp. IMCC34191]|uniref:hypothetical protein n=1 Tax=Lewinella sp. IMCC34191 TaxID=2259172 RepID=UPI000E2421BD|nr:hypothetical protein [Lewinella sp. IMCC34191]
MTRSWYVIIAVSAAIFLVNYVLPSDLNNWTKTLNFSLDPILQDDIMQTETEWKLNDSEFGRRPFMVSIMQYGTRWTGLPSPLFFTLIQFLGYVLCLLALHRLTQRVWPDKAVSPLTLLPFILVFPNLFLFTAHAHTYDDLYQYLLLLIVLYGAIDRRPLLALACAAAACVVRETSLLCLPVLAYLLWQRTSWSPVGAIIACGFAGLAALLFLYSYVPNDLAQESMAFTQTTRFFAWRANFRDYVRINETLILTIIILAPFLLLAYRYREEIRQTPVQRDLVYSAIFLALSNTTAVYITAMAREARLLLLPLLPLLPVVSPFLQQEWTGGTLRWQTYSVREWCAALLGAIVATLLYQPSVGGTGYFYRFYVFCWVGIWILIFRRLYSGAGQEIKASHFPS